VTSEQLIPIVCSVVSCGCALFVTVRAGNWRKSDEAQALFRQLAAIESRVQACEIRQEELPTKADIARVNGRLDVIGEMVTAANHGVNRIEDHFIRNYTGPK